MAAFLYATQYTQGLLAVRAGYLGVAGPASGAGGLAVPHFHYLTTVVAIAIVAQAWQDWREQYPRTILLV